MGDTRISPFYCGTQACDWRSLNCENCHKGYDYASETQRCDIEHALDRAYFGDGTVPESVARRMGYTDEAHNWQCPESEPIIPIEQWEQKLKGPPTRTAPLLTRLWRTARFAYSLWIPLWRPKEDIYGVPGRISLRLAWVVAWGIHHNDREVIPQSTKERA